MPDDTIKNCDIVDSTALGKTFKYCRTHKKESGNNFCCLLEENPFGPKDSGFSGDTSSALVGLGGILDPNFLINTASVQPQRGHQPTPIPTQSVLWLKQSVNPNSYYHFDPIMRRFVLGTGPVGPFWFYTGSNYTHFEGAPTDPGTWTLS